MTIYSKIIGTGRYLPEKIITNADLEKTLDTSDQWIQERTGIKQRHVAAEGQYTSDLAYEASLKALKASGLNKKDIDLIVVGTTTPDLVFPSTACLLQSKLGMKKIGAMDVNAACSGFIYALSVANNFIKSGTHKNVLVVGAETLTRIVNWQDRTTAVLFGDGAGAAVLTASNEPGILSTHIHATGNYADLLKTNVGPSVGMNEEIAISMKGNEVFKVAVTTLGRIVDETLEYNNLDKSDIDWLVPHQANLRIISATAKKLKMSMEQVIVTVGDTGNTSAASVPMALDIGIREGKIKPGQTVLLEAFGGGFTWGSALLKL
ncbi:MAG TPA: beta-ketoacyl-ACP synthase III [Gammaproteobacteria bacterium]|jgi:3-oxoacyl-[acyl-carrier-protein] synthase-3|nr:ketoacyl-ACP synthase III [Xanthomonadales bacterium]HOP22428.1 beta-ketoacyl-ACP synthase III [Gammaproteobacteria bacterium]HPI96198.1 beta-ketoacyl-ACP synthase III [Gammaproteobacteria bacterium]HPQ87705.1 beta-ketoacyl-ACP synthase III [Gammaproteobacteria bacterium]